MSKNYEVQEDGTLLLPADLLTDYGVNVGDKVYAIQTQNGILITPRNMLITRLLDEIGDDLKGKGITFEQMLEDSKAIRQEIYDDKYAPEKD
jgi:bifunctional DNA-binding transcriptional regulator/antitoxin component of YhaV-PrlF toxin-antitoxin module